MQVLISDANVLIDMDDGQLLERMFQLPFQFKVSDMLFQDELSELHPHLLQFGLIPTELTGDSMLEALRMTRLYAGPSRYDCFALALAKQEACPLLTGDAALRKAAEKEAVVVMGSIWLVEKMVIHGLIDKAEALAAYERMQAAGRRLPWKVPKSQLQALSIRSQSG